MNIAVITICTKDLNYRNYTIDNSKQYCDRHGYDFILYEDKIDEDAAVISNKTLTAIRNIGSYDWILMKDADSLFYNFDYRIEEYIDNDYNYIASWSKVKSMVNLGHLLIKCSTQVEIELKRIYNIIKEEVLVKGEQPIYNRFWNEGKLSPVKVLDKHIFNAHPFGKPNREVLKAWKLTMDELIDLDKKNMNLEQFGDIKQDTFIVHYPGSFLKSRSFVTERKEQRQGKEVFSFAEDFLHEFSAMHERIKKLNNGRIPIAPPPKKDIFAEPKIRKDRTKMKKIKYSK